MSKIVLGALFLAGACCLGRLGTCQNSANAETDLLPDAHSLPGFKAPRVTHKTLGQRRGANLGTTRSSDGSVLLISIAVHPTVEDAQKFVRGVVLSASERGMPPAAGSPKDTPTGRPLGDECRFLGSSVNSPASSINILARKDRCSVHLRWDNPPGTAGGKEPKAGRKFTEAEMRFAEQLVQDCFGRARTRGFIR
jgi:hypothetical protein